ncbi:MAG: CoA transferase, partial [Haloechinothrix sp.]
VSAFESVVSLLPYLTTQFEYNRSQSTLEQSGPRFISRCVDGFVVIYAGRDWSNVSDLLEDPALECDERFINTKDRFAHVAELNDLFDVWCAGRTVADATAIGEQHDVAITAVCTPAFMLEDPAFAARAGWREVRLSDRSGRIPTLPYTVDGHRPHVAMEVTR